MTRSFQPELFIGCRGEVAEAPAGVRCATSRPRPPQAYSCSTPRERNAVRTDDPAAAADRLLVRANQQSLAS